MASGNDYCPPGDGPFRTWLEGFSGGISSDPARFMLAPGQAASIQGVADDYYAALAIATNEATRTRPNIIEKDNKRSIAETLCRQYAMIIKDNGGISDSDKVSIGVRPVNPNRSPVNCPQTSPLLSILGNSPGAQTLRYSDSNTPDSKSKPVGAAAMQLFVAVGTVDAAPLADAKFHALVTKNPVGVNFDPADDGKIATYYARWSSVKGETGPWSLPVSMRIAS